MDEPRREFEDLFGRTLLDGVPAERRVGIFGIALQLEEDLQGKLARLVPAPAPTRLPGGYVAAANATLETNTSTAATSSPSMRSIASATLS